MKKLISLVFGVCGMLYGTSSWASTMCCPQNKQCGSVCCPTKGCNQEGTGCATDACVSGLIDNYGHCCPEGYVLSEGYCTYVSPCELGTSGYGIINGDCGYCADYPGYTAENGYCVQSCPEGFGLAQPGTGGHGYGVCCSDNGYGPMAWNGTYADFSPEACGCPSGFWSGYSLCIGDQNMFIYESAGSLYVHAPTTSNSLGCPSGSYAGYGSGQYTCCVFQGGTGYDLLVGSNVDGYTGELSYVQGYSYFVGYGVYPWCCPSGYAFLSGYDTCVSTSDCGYIYDEVFCGGYNEGGYSCLTLHGDTPYSFSEDGYSFSGYCCEATIGRSIYGHSVTPTSPGANYYGQICCDSDDLAFFFDASGNSTDNYTASAAMGIPLSDCVLSGSPTVAKTRLNAWVNDYYGPFAKFEWAQRYLDLLSSDDPNAYISSIQHPDGYCVCTYSGGYTAVGHLAHDFCDSICGYGY